MAGFLKKIFSFGFGKKKAKEEEEKLAAEEAAKLALPEPSAEPKPEPSAEPKPEPSAAPKSKPKAAAKKPKAVAKKLKAKTPKVEKPKAKKAPAKKIVKKAAKAPTPAPKPKIIPEVKKETPPPQVSKPKPDEPPKEVAKRLSGDASKGNVSIGRGQEVVVPEAVDAEPEKKQGWFKRLRKGLSRSSTQIKENVTAIFTKRKLDDDSLQELEDVLIQADLGVETAMRITESLSDQRYGKDVSDEEVREIMASEIEKTLDDVARPLELNLDYKPHVILVVGVNGSGKTTTIGKLTAKLNDAGLSTLLVAGDTFRAAAIEQLKIWGDRTGAPVASSKLGADAAGLAYDAYQQAIDGGHDVMLMDTAGRLQNRTELMDELEKIIRVMKKHDPDAPHSVLLTLDATTGQNALNQVEIFGKVAGVNGLVMTKLDGTARGGILVAISAKYKLPVYFVGVGEQVEDLEPFEARDFARGIAGLDDD